MKPFLFKTVEDGLAAELSMLDAVHKGRAQDSAFLWFCANACLVAPEPFRHAPDFKEVRDDFARKGVPVYLRKTGGGVTPQGPGVLNLALARSFSQRPRQSIPQVYLEICDILVETFANYSINAHPGPNEASFCDGDYNLLVGEQKIVGTAQRWRGSAVMCHALILLDVDLEAVTRNIYDFCKSVERKIPVKPDAHTTLARLLPEKESDLDLPSFSKTLFAKVEEKGYGRWFSR